MKTHLLKTVSAAAMLTAAPGLLPGQFTFELVPSGGLALTAYTGVGRYENLSAARNYPSNGICAWIVQTYEFHLSGIN